MTSFHAKATEVVSKIQHHHRVTEWLHEVVVVPEWAPLPRRCRTYAVHRREKLTEHLQNTILGLAVVINVLVMAFHDRQPKGSGYGPLEKLIVSVLGLATLGLSTLNCAVWVGLQWFDFKREGLKALRCEGAWGCGRRTMGYAALRRDMGAAKGLDRTPPSPPPRHTHAGLSVRTLLCEGQPF